MVVVFSDCEMDWTRKIEGTGQETTACAHALVRAVAIQYLVVDLNSSINIAEFFCKMV